MDNDSRGLLFFILGFTCIWLVFDEFFGKKYISNFANLLTPNIGSLTSSIASSIGNAVTNTAKSAGQATLNAGASVGSTATNQPTQKIINNSKLPSTVKKAAIAGIDPFMHGNAFNN